MIDATICRGRGGIDEKIYDLQELVSRGFLRPVRDHRSEEHMRNIQQHHAQFSRCAIHHETAFLTEPTAPITIVRRGKRIWSSRTRGPNPVRRVPAQILAARGPSMILATCLCGYDNGRRPVAFRDKVEGSAAGVALPHLGHPSSSGCRQSAGYGLLITVGVDADGTILETPGSPKLNAQRNRLRHATYPVT